METELSSVVDTDGQELSLRTGVTGFFRPKESSHVEVYGGTIYGRNNFGPPTGPGTSLAVGKGEAPPYWPYGPNGAPSHQEFDPGYGYDGDRRNRNSFVHGFYAKLQDGAYNATAIGHGNQVGIPSFADPSFRRGRHSGALGYGNVANGRNCWFFGENNKTYSGDYSGTGQVLCQGRRNASYPGLNRYLLIQGGFNCSLYAGRNGLIQGLSNYFDYCGQSTGEYSYPTIGLIQGAYNRVFGDYSRYINNNVLLGYGNWSTVNRGFAHGRYVDLLTDDQKSWGTNRLGLPISGFFAQQVESRGGAQWNELPRWLETTDASPTNIASVTLTGDRAHGVSAWIVAKNTDADGEAATFYLDEPALVNRDGGVVTHGAVTGSFSVGEKISGGTSFGEAVIRDIIDATHLRVVHNGSRPDLIDAEVITADGGGSATTTAPPTNPGAILIAGVGPAGPVTVTEKTKLGAGTGSARLVASGNEVNLEVTGIAATKIEWMGMLWFPQVAG